MANKVDSDSTCSILYNFGKYTLLYGHFYFKNKAKILVFYHLAHILCIFLLNTAVSHDGNMHMEMICR